MLRKFNSAYLILILVILVSSCASRKDVVYFQDAGNFETQIGSKTFVPKFKVDDVISIYVSSLNSEASAPFNLVRGAAEGGFVAEQVDYLVDEGGEIDFPVIGKIKVTGFSSDELRVELRKRLSEYLKDPIINIRLRNFRITILGEVTRPGTYPVIGEQITILEALGLAGDLTPEGMRENVLVIRDLDGTKIYSRIDLRTKNMIKSPVFYLTQNDVVYVEPNSRGISASDPTARSGITISIISTLITTAVIIITRL